MTDNLQLTHWQLTNNLLTTYQLTNKLPTTYRQPTNKWPTTYWQLTNNWPTTYQLTDNLPITHWQLTKNLLIIYQQPTNKWPTNYWQCTNNWPTTYQLTDNLPITHWQLTKNLLTIYQQPTNKWPTNYWQLINNWPTNYWQPTNKWPTTYWQITDKLPTTRVWVTTWYFRENPRSRLFLADKSYRLSRYLHFFLSFFLTFVCVCEGGSNPKHRVLIWRRALCQGNTGFFFLTRATALTSLLMWLVVTWSNKERNHLVTRQVNENKQLQHSCCTHMPTRVPSEMHCTPFGRTLDLFQMTTATCMSSVKTTWVQMWALKSCCVVFTQHLRDDGYSLGAWIFVFILKWQQWVTEVWRQYCSEMRQCFCFCKVEFFFFFFLISILYQPHLKQHLSEYCF